MHPFSCLQVTHKWAIYSSVMLGNKKTALIMARHTGWAKESVLISMLCNHISLIHTYIHLFLIFPWKAKPLPTLPGIQKQHITNSEIQLVIVYLAYLMRHKYITTLILKFFSHVSLWGRQELDPNAGLEHNGVTNRGSFYLLWQKHSKTKLTKTKPELQSGNWKLGTRNWEKTGRGLGHEEHRRTHSNMKT